MMSIISSLAGTVRLYYGNSYLSAAIAKVLDFHKDDVGPYVTFTHTIFHPQGGGQPSDLGHLLLSDKTRLDVTKVVEDKNSGIIKHYFCFKQLQEIARTGQGLIGEKVEQKIDLQTRILHARQHTAGHLITSIVERLQPNLEGCRGYYFPEGPYVKFKFRADEPLIGLKPTIAFTKDQLVGMAEKHVADKLQVYVHNNAMAPRIVQIGNMAAYPCGGTHLLNLKDLGVLRIRGIQNEKSEVKIKYAVS
jgi:Ser-tRNA(Ala) deacylase AlaX